MERRLTERAKRAFAERTGVPRYQLRRSRTGGWYVVDTDYGAHSGTVAVDRPDRPVGEYVYKTREAAERRCGRLNDGTVEFV